MSPTVLAGPVVFSPADIALILTVLAVTFLGVTSPGWAVLAVVLGRRGGWGARLAGAGLGVALSVATSAAVLALLDGGRWSGGTLVAVVVSWLACWGVAFLLRRPPSHDPVPGGPVPGGAGEGWGR